MKRFFGCEKRPFRFRREGRRPLKPYYLPQMSLRYFMDRIDRMTWQGSVRVSHRIERWNKWHGLL